VFLRGRILKIGQNLVNLWATVKKNSQHNTNDDREDIQMNNVTVRSSGM